MSCGARRFRPLTPTPVVVLCQALRVIGTRRHNGGVALLHLKYATCPATTPSLANSSGSEPQPGASTASSPMPNSEIRLTGFQARESAKCLFAGASDRHLRVGTAVARSGVVVDLGWIPGSVFDVA